MQGGRRVREHEKQPKPKGEDKEGLTLCVQRDPRRTEVAGRAPSIPWGWGGYHGGLCPTV